MVECTASETNCIQDPSDITRAELIRLRSRLALVGCDFAYWESEEAKGRVFYTSSLAPLR